jgi:hypothetical protein
MDVGPRSGAEFKPYQMPISDFGIETHPDVFRIGNWKTEIEIESELT